MNEVINKLKEVDLLIKSLESYNNLEDIKEVLDSKIEWLKCELITQNSRNLIKKQLSNRTTLVDLLANLHEEYDYIPVLSKDITFCILLGYEQYDCFSEGSLDYNKKFCIENQTNEFNEDYLSIKKNIGTKNIEIDNYSYSDKVETLKRKLQSFYPHCPNLDENILKIITDKGFFISPSGRVLEVDIDYECYEIICEVVKLNMNTDSLLYNQEEDIVDWLLTL